MNLIKNNIQNQLKKRILILNSNLKSYELILEYFNYLLEQNAHLNLISRKMDQQTILDNHIYDCLVGYPYFKDCRSITDLGSGSGLPGILLAILFSDKKVQLIEKSPKKAQFLKNTILKLGLSNTTVVNDLVDQVKIDTDVITCRAFKPVSQIINMTLKYFQKQNSRYILYKGKMRTIQQEVNDALTKWKFQIKYHHIEAIPDKERYLIEIIPRKNT
jgi:16S rRNA (guanine527-N7)-methyltransferase